MTKNFCIAFLFNLLISLYSIIAVTCLFFYCGFLIATACISAKRNFWPLDCLCSCVTHRCVTDWCALALHFLTCFIRKSTKGSKNLVSRWQPFISAPAVNSIKISDLKDDDFDKKSFLYQKHFRMHLRVTWSLCPQ